MKNAMDKVREFHETFGVPVSDSPRHDLKLQSLRIKLLTEEFREYLEAEECRSLTEIADALADMCVIICGTALTYGIPLDKVFDEVHRSNMSKLGEDGKPIYRGDGKVLKGPGYFKPDIAPILQDSALE